jgi:hypothetical protein
MGTHTIWLAVGNMVLQMMRHPAPSFHSLLIWSKMQVTRDSLPPAVEYVNRIKSA